MSSIRTWTHPSAGSPPRVRDQVREAAALVVFSGLTSLVLALGFVVLTRLGGQG